MTVKQLAALIPAEYRREILLTNMIGIAVPNQANEAMYYLFTIWSNYIQHEDATCPLCYPRVLGEWKKLLPSLIELEKEANFLKTV